MNHALEVAPPGSLLARARAALSSLGFGRLNRKPAIVEIPDIDPRVEDLWPLSVDEFSVPVLQRWTENKLRAHFTGHPLRDNALLNKWEFAHGRAVLKSFPWRLSVPFVTCNAQCDFCAAWLMKGKSRLDDLMDALRPVIRHCYQIDLVGWGEPLIHPQFREILSMLHTEAHQDARMALTTNGVRLEEWVDELLDANIREYAVSIHAANSDTHQDVMGFGPKDFDSAIRGVKKLVARKADVPNLDIELVLVVMRQNLEEIPAFIRMCEELGADRIHLRTLMPQDEPRENLDYHRLPPYLHPDFENLRTAVRHAIAQARIPVRAEPDTWSRAIYPPEWEARLHELPITARGGRKSYKLGETRWEELGEGQKSGHPEPCHAPEDLYGRTPPQYCPSPYTAFYVNGTDRRVIPCVYMLKVPGHEHMHFKPTMSFEDVWNSPAMVATRTSLRKGPLMPTCLKCPFHC